MASPVNARDIILEDQYRARFIRAPKQYPNSSAPWSNLWPSANNPAITNMSVSVSSSVNDPYGTDAKFYIPSTASTTHLLNAAVITNSPTAGNTYQIAMYVKADSVPTDYRIRVGLRATGSENLLYYIVSTITGAVVGSGTGTGWTNTKCTIANVGNGWWSITINGTYTNQPGVTGVRSDVYLTNSSNSTTFAGNGTSGIYIYAPQVYYNNTPDVLIGDSYINSSVDQYTWNGYGWYSTALNAKTLTLSTTAQIFTYDGDNLASPSGQWIAITAIRQNTTATTTWSTSPSVALYTAPTGGSTAVGGSTTVYMRIADFNTNTSVLVSCNVVDTVVLNDTVSIVRVRAGTNSLTGLLTNENVTVACSSDGTGYDVSNSGGSYIIYYGNTDVSNSSTYGVNAIGTASETKNGLTFSINTATGVYSLSATDWISAQESFTVKAQYNSITISKVFTISKSIAGAFGRTLCDPSVWISGTSGNQGTPTKFSAVATGTGGSNTIVSRAGPDGNISNQWKALSGTVASTGYEGGWFPTSTNLQGFAACASNMSYRFSVWVQPYTDVSADTTGRIYFGLVAQSGADVCYSTATGTVVSNPYFTSPYKNTLVAGRWYLLVGYINKYNSGQGNSALAGIYDGETGQKISPANTFEFNSGFTGLGRIGLRAFQYLTDTTASVTHFAAPRLEACDGTEPSLQQLLASAIANVATTTTDNGVKLQKGGTGASQITLIGNTAYKNADSSAAWDAGFYSSASYVGGAYASFSPAQNNAAIFIGLNSDPASDNSYTSIDYAWYVRNDGICEVRESGATKLSGISYNANDVFTVIYDGSTVRYLKNNVQHWPTATSVTAIASALFADSSFYTPGGKITNFDFGPIGNYQVVQPSNPITSSNVTTYVGSAAIGALQVGSVSVGVVSNAVNNNTTSGGRVEIDATSGGRIRIYDTSNVLRVRIGYLL